MACAQLTPAGALPTMASVSPGATPLRMRQAGQLHALPLDESQDEA